jgi:glycosyltransferase involved in cell wall biosynthesis
MRVALDAAPLTLSCGGIQRYVWELSGALAAAFPEDEYTLVADRPFAAPQAPNLKTGAGPRNALERRWFLWGLPRELARRRIDVFHGTNFEVPWLPLRPSVMTVQDLSPWINPAWNPATGRVRRRTAAMLRLGLASMVITPSEAVRREAIERFRLSPHRVAAVPDAAAPHFRPVEPPARAPYFLYVGALEPRKNLPMLIEAWRAARKTAPVDLVLAGRPREGFPKIIAEPGLSVLGEVAESGLPALYSGAVAAVYPSLYEGFGLPVLEAMQCGAPVIASRDPAIAETAGGAATLLDACDVRAWTEALIAAATRPEWAAAQREKSLARAREFSWERTARLTREVYVEALGRSGEHPRTVHGA